MPGSKPQLYRNNSLCYSKYSGVDANGVTTLYGMILGCIGDGC